MEPCNNLKTEDRFVWRPQRGTRTALFRWLTLPESEAGSRDSQGTSTEIGENEMLGWVHLNCLSLQMERLPLQSRGLRRACVSLAQLVAVLDP